MCHEYVKKHIDNIWKMAYYDDVTETIQKTGRRGQEMEVKEFMSKSGIPLDLKGWPLVKRGIELGTEMPEISVEKIYEIIAEENNISKAAAERRMRWAITQGYPNMDSELKNKIFANKKEISSGRYIKSVSIAILNDII